MHNLIKALFAICLLFTMARCGVNKEIVEERKSWKFTTWGQEFKNRAFCLCVLQGQNNKAVQDSMLKYDKSFYNPLAVAIFDSAINEMLKKEIKQMQIDSAHSIGTHPADIQEVLEGKRVMNHCIEFYKSKRLDAVMKSEKKSWKQINSIMDKIHEKIPTY